MSADEESPLQKLLDTFNGMAGQLDHIAEERKGAQKARALGGSTAWREAARRLQDVLAICKPVPLCACGCGQPARWASPACERQAAADDLAAQIRGNLPPGCKDEPSEGLTQRMERLAQQLGVRVGRRFRIDADEVVEVLALEHGVGARVRTVEGKKVGEELRYTLRSVADWTLLEEGSA